MFASDCHYQEFGYTPGGAGFFIQVYHPDAVPAIPRYINTLNIKQFE